MTIADMTMFAGMAAMAVCVSVMTVGKVRQLNAMLGAYGKLSRAKAMSRRRAHIGCPPRQGMDKITRRPADGRD